uniref:Auxin efflux carrier component n=1 Tax=Haptolina ericina TaxID=156174 RepID=A0A7S3BZG2_9EUKA
MTKEVTKALSMLSMRVTIPALLFTSVLPAINTHLIRRVWPMFFFPVIYASIGAFLGWLIILICKPPDDFRHGTIAAVAFGNSTGMPFVLLSVISKQLRGWWFRLKGIDPKMIKDPEMVAEPLVYLSVYLITYPIVQWGVGSWLLRPQTATAAKPVLMNAGALRALTRTDARGSDPEADQKREVSAGEAARALAAGDCPDARANASFIDAVAEGELVGAISSGGVAQDTHERGALAPPFLPLHSGDREASRGLAQPLLDGTPWQPSQRPLEERCREWLASAGRVGGKLREQVLVPPVRAVLLGLICSSVDVTYFLLCGGEYGTRLVPTDCPENDAYLGWLTGGLTALGKAAVPINLILTGNALSKGPDWSSLSTKANLGIILGKMVFLPLCAMLLMVIVDRTLTERGAHWLSLEEPWDEPFYVAALAVSATPSANNLMVMVELSGGNRAAMSTSIFTQYMAAPLVLPITLTASVFVASCL